MKFTAVAVVVFLTVQGASAGDRVFLCNGTYRNKPCDNQMEGQEHKLPPLTRYRARNYYIPPVSSASLPEEKASLNPLKLNEPPQALEEATPAPPVAEENFKVSGPEVDKFIAKSRGED